MQSKYHRMKDVAMYQASYQVDGLIAVKGIYDHFDVNFILGPLKLY